LYDIEKIDKKIDILYNRYYLEVYRFLICFSGNQNDAEDLTQEVFLRVLNNLSKNQIIISPKTWILSIAKHVAIDHYRKRRFCSLLKCTLCKGHFEKSSWRLEEDGVWSPSLGSNDLDNDRNKSYNF